MKNKLEKFQVEELEQRFETGKWVSKVKTGIILESNDGKWRGELNATWKV